MDEMSVAQERSGAESCSLNLMIFTRIISFHEELIFIGINVELDGKA